VAHRLSILRDADRIFVFDEGRIVEVGNFEDLVSKGGMFTNLFMSAKNGVSPNTSPESPRLVAAPAKPVQQTAGNAPVPDSLAAPVSISDADNMAEV
jgi:ABC-type microcin C transport system duplicated ATPase subunit YejF